MRCAGRLLRWRCVRRHSPCQPLRLQQGPTMAQGVTPMRITPAITPGGTTLIRYYRHMVRASRWERGVAQMQARGFADTNASLSSSATPGAMAMSGGFGSSNIVAEARRYIGGNPTSRGSLWCARFMNMVLQHSGYRGTGSERARRVG